VIFSILDFRFAICGSIPEWRFARGGRDWQIEAVRKLNEQNQLPITNRQLAVVL
jgi:hypothetical protein